MRRKTDWAPLLAWLAALVALVAFPVVASAHDDSCHRLKICPSDKDPAGYRCGDNSRGICNEANLPDEDDDNAGEDLTGPPDRGDCNDFPEYYTQKVCAAVLGRPVPVASPQAAAATAQPAPATPAPAPLPKNGADEALMALTGGTLVELGYGLVLLSERIKRRRRGPVYLQPTLF